MSSHYNILFDTMNNNVVWDDVALVHTDQDEFTFRSRENKVPLEKFPQEFASSTLTEISRFLVQTMDAQLERIEQSIRNGLESGIFSEEIESAIKEKERSKEIDGLVAQKESLIGLASDIDLLVKTQDFLSKIDKQIEVLADADISRKFKHTDAERFSKLNVIKQSLDDCSKLFVEIATFCDEDLASILSTEAEIKQGEIAPFLKNLAEQTENIAYGINLRSQSYNRKSSSNEERGRG